MIGGGLGWRRDGFIVESEGGEAEFGTESLCFFDGEFDDFFGHGFELGCLRS